VLGEGSGERFHEAAPDSVIGDAILVFFLEFLVFRAKTVEGCAE